MKNKNEYKVKKNIIREKATDRVVSIYYSVVRLERYFFDLIGPYVWKEYTSWDYWAESYHIKYHHYSDSYDALMLKERLNSDLFRVKIETYDDSEIWE